MIKKYWEDSEEKLITYVVLAVPLLFRFLYPFSIYILYFCFIIVIDILLYVFLNKVDEKRKMETRAKKVLIHNSCDLFCKWSFTILFFRIVEGEFYSIKFYFSVYCFLLVLMIVDFYIKIKRDKK